MRELNVGDKVTIKNNLVVESKAPAGVTIEMLRYGGKTLTIKSKSFKEKYDCYMYKLEGNSWSWLEEMFEEEEKDMALNFDDGVNLVYVQFENSVKEYIYVVPDGVTLNQGDMVFVPTENGTLVAKCVTNNFIMPMLAVGQLIPLTIKLKLKTVIGYARQEKYRLEKFEVEDN